MHPSVSNQFATRGFILRNRWVPEGNFWPISSGETGNSARHPLSGEDVISIIDKNELSILNARRNFIEIFDKKKKRTGKLLRFNPIIYFNIFGKKDVFDLLSLSIDSIRGVGRYDGYIGIICDQVPNYLKYLGPKILICSSEHGGYFGRYNIPHCWRPEFNPFLYVDTDVLTIAPVDSLVLDLLSLEALSCSTENRVHPDMRGRSPREWNDVERQRERGVWFGSRQYEGSELFDRQDVNLYNSGIFGFSASDKNFSILDSIYALGRAYDKEFIKKFGDQPIANYFFNCSEGRVASDNIIDKHSQIYREGYTPLDPGKTLIHFPWNFESSKFDRMKDMAAARLPPASGNKSVYAAADFSFLRKDTDIYENCDFLKVGYSLGIAITTFNRVSLLENLIKTLKNCTSSPFALVVCDDGSVDGTIEFLKKSRIPFVSGKNKGIAWNKNRGIFVLNEILNCENIILLDDDAIIDEVGWERDWVASISRFGHMCHWFTEVQDSIIGGSGVADDPWITSLIQGVAIGLCRRAISVVGYMDTRFGKYGHEHTDYSIRHRKVGFGGIRRRDGSDSPENYFLAIRGGVSVASDAVSSRPDDMSESNLFFRESQSKPVYRAPWKDDTDLSEFLNEIGAFYEREYGDQHTFDNIFDDNDYLAANPDVLNAGFDPWTHFLKFGFRDRRLLRPGSLIFGDGGLSVGEKSGVSAVQPVDRLYPTDRGRQQVFDVDFGSFVGVTEIRIPVDVDSAPDSQAVTIISIEMGPADDRLTGVYDYSSDARAIRFDPAYIAFVANFPILARMARIRLVARPGVRLGKIEVVGDKLPSFIEETLLKF